MTTKRCDACGADFSPGQDCRRKRGASRPEGCLADAAAPAVSQAREVVAQAMPVAWRARGYGQFKTGQPGPWGYKTGAECPKYNNPECCDIEPLYSAPVAAPAAMPAEPTSPLMTGFDGSSVSAGPNHSTIEIWYDTHEQAVAAHGAILGFIEAPVPAGGALEDMRKRKDAAYEERNKVVAALARLFPSGVAKTAIEGWSEDWHGCVYIDLPTRQVSWHFHDSQAHLFDGLPQYAGAWDGHDTDEKYRRLAALGRHECDGKDPRGCWNVRCQLGGTCCRTAAPAVQPPAAIEQIAQQWDGCMYDAIGGAIDIGATIREDGVPHSLRAAVNVSAAAAEPSQPASIKRGGWDFANDRPIMRNAPVEAPSLSELNELAKVYASSYASPHHVTFTVAGLRNLLIAASPPAEALTQEPMALVMRNPAPDAAAAPPAPQPMVMLTEEEIDKLLPNIQGPRNRALIATSAPAIQRAFADKNGAALKDAS
jgi:hypothetical protein